MSVTVPPLPGKHATKNRKWLIYGGIGVAALILLLITRGSSSSSTGTTTSSTAGTNYNNGYQAGLTAGESAVQASTVDEHSGW